MDLNFYKIQSFQNDIILINGITQPLPSRRLFPYLATSICNRHKGVGANGLLFVLPGKEEKVSIEYYNPAGKISQNSNDCLISLGRYLFDSGMFNEDSMYIEMNNSKRKLTAINSDNFRIEMPEPKYINSDQILKHYLDKDYNSTFYIENKKYSTVLLNIQSNGFVFFIDDIDSNTGNKIKKAVKNSAEIENADCVFVSNYSNDLLVVKTKPDKLNVDFSRTASMAFVASVLNNFTDRESIVKINNCDAYLGWNFKTNILSVAGKAEYVFSGTYYFPD